MPNNEFISQLNWNACQINEMQFHQIKRYMQSQLYDCYFNGNVFKIVKEPVGQGFAELMCPRSLTIKENCSFF